MVGVLGAVVLAAQAGDYHAGLVVLTVGAATAVVAGVVAFATAAAGLASATAVGKALATFLQFVAAGLATVTFASLADLASFPHVAVPLLIAAAVAALQTFAQNVAEARPA
jgi:hypothetical protein